MGTNEEVRFVEMARARPARTALFTGGPPAFAVFQLLNGYFNGGNLHLIGVLAAVMVAFAVVTTRYHMTEYRLARLGATGTRPG